MLIDVLLKKGVFTNQEQAVIDYILGNPDIVLHCTAKKLASLTYVSSPTIIRLVKKIGFEGYLEFQLAYAKEYAKNQNSTISTLTKDSTITEIMDTLPEIYNLIFQETKSIVKKEVFIRTINYLLQADNIDFYANDNNHHLVQATCSKLNSLGFRVQAFNTINDHYVESLNPNTAISFVVSHTGNNHTMMDSAIYLKSKGIRVIAITGYPNSKLEAICHESLFIDTSLYSLPKELHLYGISIHYILEVLVTALALKRQK